MFPFAILNLGLETCRSPPFIISESFLFPNYCVLLGEVSADTKDSPQPPDGSLEGGHLRGGGTVLCWERGYESLWAKQRTTVYNGPRYSGNLAFTGPL